MDTNSWRIELRSFFTNPGCFEACANDSNPSLLGVQRLDSRTVNPHFSLVMGVIPSRAALKTTVEKFEFKELPPSRVEKERRILLAFDTIRCSINYGE